MLPVKEDPKEDHQIQTKRPDGSEVYGPWLEVDGTCALALRFSSLPFLWSSHGCSAARTVDASVSDLAHPFSPGVERLLLLIRDVNDCRPISDRDHLARG
jgi:hypothetical protein